MEASVSWSPASPTIQQLLLVTMGYSELLLARHTEANQDRADLEEIRDAAARGAVLTRQLLGFGRKHDIQPLRIDLNRTVATSASC